MLRVGLTGGLGSGKSTVAAILRELGAEVIEADALGRELMEPGQPVYSEIVRAFGSGIVDPDGRLNRARLAKLAFDGEDGNHRLNELNAIVHPAVIAAQQRWMELVFARDSAAIAVVESALIFEVERDARIRGESDTVLADWHRRIDRIIVVTAPEELKIARFVDRVCPNGIGREAASADARLRLAHQITDLEKASLANYVIDNRGDREHLYAQTKEIWRRLKMEGNFSVPQGLSE